MPTGDTIAAVASAPIRSTRAVVRLSGPGVPKLLDSIVDPTPTSRGAHTCLLRLEGAVGVVGIELPTLVAYYPAPSSYTGEHCAELLLPGNPRLIERIINALASMPGVRHAEPGEFTARAYFNAKLTLEQAEGVAQTIAAEHDDQLDEASRILAGRAGNEYRAWAAELAELLALVEAGIDFTDSEDVIAIAPRLLAGRLNTVAADIDSRLGARAGAEARTDTPSVVLVGRPNAGKSTLFNALLGRRRVVESKTPGSTRDVISETLDLADVVPGAPQILLSDLPGLDPSAQNQSQAAALDAITNADLVIHCDPAGRFNAAPTQAADKKTIRVRTKADLPGPDAQISVCALDGYRLDILRRAIADSATGGASSMLPRHHAALVETRRHIAHTHRAFDPKTDRLADPELVASSLRAALDAIGQLVGRIEPDEIIGRIFATFCVGK